MKKVLLILFVLAICMLAFPQGVMAADPISPDPVLIEATYEGSELDFNVDLAPTEGWLLSVAGNGNDNNWPDALTFTVSASHAWSVSADDIKADTDANEGFMMGDEGPLTTPIWMEINQGGSPNSIVSRPNVLEGYGPIPPDTIYTSDLWQRVLDSDFGSLNPFAITIRFTCTSAF
jgi:hypothetical protein